jgi:hypothetical protein
MNSIKELIQVLDPLLGSVKWHSHLANIIQDYLNNIEHTSLTIDNLLSATTKLVETYLRDSIRNFIGGEVPPQNSYGVNLLNYAKTKGFIPEPQRQGNCIYSLIYWYFEKLRNPTHHSFTDFPLPTILMIISSANFILNEIDHLKREHEFYGAKKILFEYDPPSYTLSVEVEDIEKDGETIVPLNLEMHLINPDKSVLRFPLINQGNNWNVKVNTIGYAKGTYRVDLAGVVWGKERFNISGSSLVII